MKTNSLNRNHNHKEHAYRTDQKKYLYDALTFWGAYQFIPITL